MTPFTFFVLRNPEATLVRSRIGLRLVSGRTLRKTIEDPERGERGALDLWKVFLHDCDYRFILPWIERDLQAVVRWFLHYQP